ncbi:vegetative cell wall protein gp1-like [Arachis stenosperma]|uniref:vegetative cell wall protein gp1-like n=1 Tax=Arachis stenosperma TaxID=217475 RepID=UPI0025ACDB8F|nr:vegetative cell wall protein gp1-like [Arachis stenosperma]
MNERDLRFLVKQPRWMWTLFGTVAHATDGMPCLHALAAIRKRHDTPHDYVHPWLCMESIRRKYAHCIKPVPSPKFCARTEFSKPDPPITKRPIGRPKVHNRQKDPAEPLMQEEKLKRSFIVSSSKCGEKDHNYKTCKGAPTNPNWKSKTRRPRKKAASSSQSLIVLPLSQSAPPPEDASSSQPSSSTSLTPNPTVVESPAPSNPLIPPIPTRVTRSTFVISPPGPTATQTRPPAPTIGRPFKPPRKVNDTARPQQSRFRPKQKIFRPPAPIATSRIQPNTQQATPSTIPSAAPNQEAPSPNLPTSPKTKDSK